MRIRQKLSFDKQKKSITVSLIANLLAHGTAPAPWTRLKVKGIRIANRMQVLLEPLADFICGLEIRVHKKPLARLFALPTPFFIFVIFCKNH